MISDKQNKIRAFQYTDYDALICDGSIRSGKTSIMMVSFIDWAMRRFSGMNFGICGKTVASANRNIVYPYINLNYARKRYTLSHKKTESMLIVKNNEKTNYFYIFGGKDESSFKLIQGITLAGIMLDEVALMPRSFVEQAIARCSIEGSKFWFNCNPEDPDHWFNQEWIMRHEEKNALLLHFELEDNPSLSERIINRYKSLYTGVFYQRYILGQWVRAEGVIFKQFADAPEKWICSNDIDERELSFITFGIDFGESVSHTIFCATGFLKNRGGIIALDERKIVSKGVSPDKIEVEFVQFVKDVGLEFPKTKLTYAFCDHPETIVNGINKALYAAGLRISAVMAKKEEINARLFAQERMFNMGLLKIRKKCEILIHSLKNQTWDSKFPNQRLDADPNINDVADAFEYSWEEFIDEIGAKL